MKKKIIESIIDQTPRDKIFSTIVQNPGLHFREIQRRTNYATGAVQYHIDYLKKKNLIHEIKEGKFTRYYSVEEKSNSKILNLLRQNQVRLIVLFLLNQRRATIKAISIATKLNSPIVLFHLKKLISASVVKEEKIKELTFYSIINKEPIMELLIIHKKSFLDKLVDNFVKIWEEELNLEFG